MIEIDKKMMAALDKAITLGDSLGSLGLGIEPLKDLRAECVVKEKTLQEELDELRFKSSGSAKIEFRADGSFVKFRQPCDGWGYSWYYDSLRELSAHLLKVADVLEQHK